ncbi:hypothetical protein [Catellatospora sichuanensis]|uniref:hypothetical protein n=1 Tax=Catellatospora sichuanensis TaxID=1969805 RepID=UPI00118222B3|nr:hypothetical protein [Catellatospora sichuanensis]
MVVLAMAAGWRMPVGGPPGSPAGRVGGLVGAQAADQVVGDDGVRFDGDQDFCGVEDLGANAEPDGVRFIGVDRGVPGEVNDGGEEAVVGFQPTWMV